MQQRFPTSTEISAALAALGVYAQEPSAEELIEQAIGVGGESVLAAVLANALYGASIGCGMLAEGRMLTLDSDCAQEHMSLARSQALQASGAEGPGFVGAMHWQAAHVAGPLRALKDSDHVPLGQALAAASWAVVLILNAMAAADPVGGRSGEVTEALADAGAELARAQAHLESLDEQTLSLASELESVIAAARDAMSARDNRDHG